MDPKKEIRHIYLCIAVMGVGQIMSGLGLRSRDREIDTLKATVAHVGPKCVCGKTPPGVIGRDE